MRSDPEVVHFWRIIDEAAFLESPSNIGFRCMLGILILLMNQPNKSVFWQIHIAARLDESTSRIINLCPTYKDERK